MYDESKEDNHQQLGNFPHDIVEDLLILGLGGMVTIASIYRLNLKNTRKRLLRILIQRCPTLRTKSKHFESQGSIF